MHCRRQELDPRIYWLVEHLDAALAVGEQLQCLSLEMTEPTPQMGPRRLRARVARFIRFVSQVRALEASLIAHMLQARRRVGELPKGRGPLRLLLDPFASGTTVLMDAVAEYGDPAGFAFNSGADRLAYLRARGLVAADSGALMPAHTFEISESFLVAGRIELGPLLDLVEAFLNALNTEFGIWNDDSDLLPSEPVISDAPSLSDQIASARKLVLGEQIADVRAMLGRSKSAEAGPPSDASPRPGSLAAALEELRALRSTSD